MNVSSLLGKKITVVTKRKDPNYAQVSGYIPKDLAIRFKIACTARQITQSEGLEEAIIKWLEHNPPNSPAEESAS